MTPTDKTERAAYVQDLFTRIAGRYDLMNRLMTGGRDVLWRRKMIRLIKQPADACILDVGAGTGDLSREMSRRFPEANVTAADFTLGMLLAGKNWPDIGRSTADAMQLPYADNCFDTVVSGFLVRNVTDVDLTLKEMLRVTKPGGQVLILDMTRPRKNLLSPFINLYMNRIVPLIGTLITGQKDAYTYLPDSTQNFLRAEVLAEKMKNAGFDGVDFIILNFGTVAIHSAVVPPTK